MATLKLTIFKAKVLKNGKHKIRIALCHKGETCYILTRYLIDSENQFKNGLIQKRPDASMMNMHLRSLLNAYQEKLNEVQNQSMYTAIEGYYIKKCTNLRIFNIQKCFNRVHQRTHSGRTG